MRGFRRSAPQRAQDELPPDESELIGRDSTISEADERIEHQRLVTLWGPGGVGRHDWLFKSPRRPIEVRRRSPLHRSRGTR